MSRTLPIQNVSFRGEIDSFLTEGGGSSKLPKWVTYDEVKQNSIRVRTQLSTLSEAFNNGRALPLLTEVSLNENATAKSYRPAIRKMLDVGNKKNVLGVSSVGKLIVKIDTRSDLDRISSNFNYMDGQMPKSTRLGLAAIEDIVKYFSVIDDEIAENDCVKIQLVDYQNNDLNYRSRLLLEGFCSRTGLELDELHYASDIRLFSIKNITTYALSQIATMDAVLSVRKMPTIEFEVSAEPENTNIEVMRPRDGVVYPTVGLLDSGVANIEHLRPWLTPAEDNVADLPENDIASGHGTAVASVINYGDFLEDRDMTACGPCKIQSCIVNTDARLVSIMENELVMHIQQAINAHPDIKIWNLSQGTNMTIKDNKYSDFGIALDSLQKDNNVLICKSAGNDASCTPLRITEGADSILSLVVGSIAHKKATEHDADENDRSPFSRIGPGVENVVKPDLVHYGGNIDSHLSLLSEWGRQYSCYSGTSFSTPRITSLAANLQQKIGGECNPLLIKALLVHYSNYPSHLAKTASELRKEMGFGLPCLISDMLVNDEDECTMVFTHTLDKGRDIVSLDFPYPTQLVDDDKFIGDITLTMAVNPMLNASQGSEYCQSQVDVMLQTYDHVEHVPLGENSIFRNEHRTSNDATNVLNANLYSKSAFKSKYANERMLIEHGDKYQPIKKYCVDLSKMTPTNKEKVLGSNRKWALKLKGLYRDTAEQALLRDGEALSQDVVVVITIKDPTKRGIVYSECLRLLEERGYIHNDISINNGIEVAVQ